MFFLPLKKSKKQTIIGMLLVFPKLAATFYTSERKVIHMTTQPSNPLATDKISTLIARFSVPSIIAMLVSAVYNIADQLFIGNAVGTLGNAATNIAFPLAMMCTGLGLLFGIGGAATFNLHMGANKKEEAPYFVGNSIMMLMTTGVLLFLLTELFLTPLLIGFGSPSNVLPLARQYVRVTAIGFPFLILTIGSGHLIRADGSPKMAMFVNISGAVINIALDAVFVLIFKWGMYGAAAATVIGQVISTIIAVCYLLHYRTVKLERQHLIPNETYLGQICSLGMASAINQVAMMIVQITMNNLLKKYGAQSSYGDAIPIACAGIVMKVNQLYFSVIIGLSQGSQPIQSFNYGARQYKRVKDSYRMAITIGAIVSIASFLLFQFYPREILRLFGNGTKEYFDFGIRYFRVFLLLTWLNFMQPISSTFFSSIGKAYKGTFLSLTRQILFLLPLLLILPHFFGIMGVLYASPVADLLSFAVGLGMVIQEFRYINRLELEASAS